MLSVKGRLTIRKGQGLNGSSNDLRRDDKAVYEAPTLKRLGFFHVETRICFWGKQIGGYDGIHFDGVEVPVSACS